MIPAPTFLASLSVGNLPRDPEQLIRLLLESLAENRWMFWNLLVLGVLQLLLATVFYRPYLRIWRELAEGELGKPLREQNPKFVPLLERSRRWLESPRYRWGALVFGILFTLAGVAGLLLLSPDRVQN